MLGQLVPEQCHSNVSQNSVTRPGLAGQRRHGGSGAISPTNPPPSTHSAIATLPSPLDTWLLDLPAPRPPTPGQSYADWYDSLGDPYDVQDPDGGMPGRAFLKPEVGDLWREGR